MTPALIFKARESCAESAFISRETLRLTDWRGGWRKDMCAQFEAQGHVGIVVFVFSKRCTFGVRIKRRGRVGKGRKGFVRAVRTLHKPFMKPPLTVSR